MTGQGRRPKPTAIKELEGNPGKRTLNKSEPKPGRLSRAPVCPAFLKGLARAQWNKMAPELARLGVLTKIDLDALARYCLIYQRWREAEIEVKRLGVVCKTVKGNLVQNPWLSVANRSNEQLNKLATEFGLTPSSRSKVSAEPMDEKNQKGLEKDLFGPEVKVSKGKK
jgi:P27 family predicted phage terminase small subunit